MHHPKTKRSRSARPLVIVAAKPGAPLKQEIGQAIVQQAAHFGWDLWDLGFSGGVLPSNRTPSGIITSLFTSSPIRQSMEELNCPLVWLSQGTDPIAPVNCIVPDQAGAGRLTAEHFAERGFQDIAYVGYDPWGNSKALHDALSQSSEDLGMTFHPLRLNAEHAWFSPEGHTDRRGATRQWLLDMPKPIALLVASSPMAARICGLCLEIGLAVPEDVSILCSGNDLYVCEMAPVSLSSIDPDRERQGSEAARLLHHLMEGRRGPERQIVIPPKGVVARRSTDMLAISDRLVSAALRFMWDNLEVNLSVDDIAAELGVHRRKLERTFRACLNRGVNEELRRKRFERCRHLLRTTDETIGDICRSAGYQSRDYMYQTFRRELDMSPGEYRRRS